MIHCPKNISTLIANLAKDCLQGACKIDAVPPARSIDRAGSELGTLDLMA